MLDSSGSNSQPDGRHKPDHQRRPSLRIALLIVVPLLAFGHGVLRSAFAKGHRPPVRAKNYVPPRPAFDGIHVAMSEDSARLLFRKIAKRHDEMKVDELTLLESDSVDIFGFPAYMQLQFKQQRVQTIVINYHPMGGGDYLDLRDKLDKYLVKYFGGGLILTKETVTFHRWETEDGTSEISHSDKYMRIFIRLGEPRVY